MEFSTILSLFQESLFLLLVLAVFLVFAMLRGTQAIINLILSLYLALLISLKFPYYDTFLENVADSSRTLAMIIIFALFTGAAYLLFSRLIPNESFDTAFQHFGKKVLAATFATILVMAYSYHALPVTELITPGSPIQSLFAPESNFFWWLMLPLVGLFFL